MTQGQFLRRNWKKLSRLGARGRKNKRKWKKPTGRDNKMREMRKGYPAVVKPGYRKQKEERLVFPVVNNVKDVKNLSSNTEKVKVGKIGGRKKYDVLKEILNSGLKVENLSPQKEINKIEKSLKERRKKSNKSKTEKQKDKTKSEKQKSTTEDKKASGEDKKETSSNEEKNKEKSDNKSENSKTSSSKTNKSSSSREKENKK